MRFDAADLRRWPIDEAELAPFYDWATAEMGLCGTGDRPPLRPVAAIARLLAAARTSSSPDLRLEPFLPTLAVETRPGTTRCCTYSGDCMAGCPRQSIYSASITIERMIAEGVLCKVTAAKVLAVHSQSRTLSILWEKGEQEQVGPFDLILVAAGCLGTAQILLRTLPAVSALDMLDNPVFTFPILVTGGTVAPAEDAGYFGMTNGCITVIPKDPALPSASVQLYPAMDHLWAYFTPGGLWSALVPVGRLLRQHLVIGRLYLHSDHGSVIRMGLAANGAPRLSLRRTGGMPVGLWRSLRRALGCQGFLVPSVPLLRQKTSSHYAGTLPYGTAGVDANGRLEPGVYLCDSTVFPDSPAASPTLTIMAAAMRTAMAAQPA
ncbi:GMC oxidoreductase [Magnetospirillum sulfuroxidans]|uniref:Uncharacterized protein n=1 Tax=Magnetospirillum sulfuroxidans TaxID=611300 RepID=A0ABS5IED4_9PROT|nr:GMC oxidoreductase [Magnetospirillum sulfuroxidans]MBR9972778.1 hypothetical protein [Magnetospirillum sulfuroxidans]